jgi:hypothetical protein
MKNEPESAEYRYSVAIEQCDVDDREALELYREKRYEWLSWYELRDGERNTIQHQIFEMMFYDLAYRTLVVPRQKTDSMVSAQSGLLTRVLDEGYVAMQILFIRRMLDADKNVFSIRRLLDDITEHRLLITREIYVCHDGLPYNPNSWQGLPQEPMMKCLGIEAPGLGNYLSSKYRHEKFDSLSGISQDQRKRSDRIRTGVFQELKKWLTSSSADKLIRLGNKFFAHAATPDSRGSLQYSGISFVDVDNVQRALVRVERAITDFLLFVGIARDVVPMPPLGLLKGLDAPYTTGDMIQKMEDRWDELVTERNQWSNGIAEDLK